MRKIFAVALLIMLIMSFSACQRKETAAEETAPTNEIYREHQEITSAQVSFAPDNMLRISIPEVGLENVFLRDASESMLLDGDLYGQVYLLADDRHGSDRFASDHYLAVVTDKMLIVEDLLAYENQTSYSGDIQLCDLDGDGDNEILLHECVAMSGGWGQYLSRVFNFENGKIVEIFTGHEGELPIDTGYSITILKNQEFKIENRLTGYSEVFHHENGTEEYYSFWYDENGEPYSSQSIMVDSFYDFFGEDVDEDGVYEIVCRQYVSLIGHADGIGTTKTVLKYNKETAVFEVVSAEFETFQQEDSAY